MMALKPLDGQDDGLRTNQKDLHIQVELTCSIGQFLGYECVPGLAPLDSTDLILTR